MSDYKTLPAEYKLYFKRLLDDKPDLDYMGRKVSWDEMRSSVKILSEPTDAKNTEKLPFKKGLETYRLASKNGKKLIVGRVRESSIAVLLNEFPHI